MKLITYKAKDSELKDLFVDEKVPTEEDMDTYYKMQLVAVKSSRGKTELTFKLTK